MATIVIRRIRPQGLERKTRHGVVHAAQTGHAKLSAFQGADRRHVISGGNQEVEARIRRVNRAHGLALGGNQSDDVRGSYVAHVNLACDHRRNGDRRAVKLNQLHIKPLALVESQVPCQPKHGIGERRRGRGAEPQAQLELACFSFCRSGETMRQRQQGARQHQHSR
jgi:hypothetical protein